MDSFWIILSGSLIVISCSLLGCFLILRKMAMIGDAISHAILPGIVVAFLVQGGLNSFHTFFGAVLVGLLSTFLISFLNVKGKLQLDASIGTVFTSLFAIGIILIAFYAKNIDIDQECVLYGEIAFIPLDIWITKSGINLGPIAVWQLSIVTLVVIAFVVFGFQYLKITSFDPTFAITLGISTTLWHYLLMGAVSLVTVSAFEAVGAILVIAILVVPPSTAYLLTQNLKHLCLLSITFGVFSVIFGYFLALYINSSIAGSIATVNGLFFALAFIFSLFKNRTLSKLNEPILTT